MHVTKDSTRAPTHQTRVKIAREVSMVMKSAELLSRAHAKFVVEENLTISRELPASLRASSAPQESGVQKRVPTLIRRATRVSQELGAIKQVPP